MGIAGLALLALGAAVFLAGWVVAAAPRLYGPSGRAHTRLFAIAGFLLLSGASLLFLR